MKIYFNFFSKDPKSPWSQRARYNIRWGIYAAAVIVILLGYSVFTIYQDLTFVSGSTITSATLVNVSGQHTDRQGHLTYDGTYEYQVDGQPYQVVATESSSNFKADRQVVYKDANPNNAEVLYDSTPAVAAVRMVVISLVLLVLAFFFFYFLAGL